MFGEFPFQFCMSRAKLCQEGKRGGWKEAFVKLGEGSGEKD